MRKTIEVLLTLLAVVVAISQLAGCVTLGVQPWERDLLAQEDMQLETDPVMAALDDHIYFSKEASTGGASLGGGGCGCN